MASKNIPPPIPGHVGPFPPGGKPVRPGVFKRVSAKTGNLVYAYWDGYGWAPFSSSWTSAKAKRGRKYSRKQLWWYGMARSA